MKSKQFAKMKFKNGATMFLNAEYITAYGYIKDRDETVVATLCEQTPAFFPGDQTEEIETATNWIEAGRRDDDA